MPENPFHDRLAVCSWSLQPANPQELISRMKAVGLSRLQIALDPIRESPGIWGDAQSICADNGLRFVSGMVATKGEDYSTLESIRRTGGVVPDETWPDNWKNIQEDAKIAEKLGLPLVMMHAGFLPEEEGDPDFAKLQERIGMIADLFADKGIILAFETGQETADTLNRFLDHLNRSNVGVNFDPANMILYDKGDPIQAMRSLSGRLRSCHIKDANRTKQPGTWGEEVVVGTGEVDWPGFFKVLQEIGYQGDLCIEREAGDQRVEDIRKARELIERTAPKS